MMSGSHRDCLSCDVAIVGGGPSGAVAALTLTRLGRRVVILESARGDRTRVGETLPPSVQPLLQALGLWEAFGRLKSVPSFGTRSIWGGDDLRSQSFVFSPYGNGWHVDRAGFDWLLLDAARMSGAIAVLGAHVIACDRVAGGWRLQTHGWDRYGGCAPATTASLETSIAARAVIDASGRSSAVSVRLGARRDVVDRLVGIAVRYSPEHAQEPPVGNCQPLHAQLHRAGAFTLVEALRDGWCYTAPLPGDGLIAVEMTDPDLLGDSRQDRLTAWQDRLAAAPHTLKRLNGLRMVREPYMVSAMSHRLRRPHLNDPWLAAGDAALGVDPLSASGLKRALQTGHDSAVAINAWLDGDRIIAKRYEAELDSDFRSSLASRARYYTMETRWPESRFWSRRHQHYTTRGGQ